MNKCINCGHMNDSYTCTACGYVDQGLKEHLENEARMAGEAEAELDRQRAANAEIDLSNVDLRLTVMELHELQFALSRLPKSPILDMVLDKIGSLVESVQK